MSEINSPEYGVNYVQGGDRTLVILYGKRVESTILRYRSTVYGVALESRHSDALI